MGGGRAADVSRATSRRTDPATSSVAITYGGLRIRTLVGGQQMSTREVAKRYSDLWFDELPSNVLARAEQFVLDTLGLRSPVKTFLEFACG
jgi:hypothetical protein